MGAVTLSGEFHLPVAFDLTATFLFAITGTLAGMRRHFDIIGVFALAFATALGGGLVRDGVFISSGPPVAITNGYYLPLVTVAVLITILIGRIVPPVRRILSVVPTSNDDSVLPLVKSPHTTPLEGRESGPRSVFERLNLEDRLAKTYITVLSLVDALGLGIYAVVGAQKSLDHGLPVGAAILVGAVNASGGGLLRDVLTREVPLLFKPGQFYAWPWSAPSCLSFSFWWAVLTFNAPPLLRSGRHFFCGFLPFGSIGAARRWSGRSKGKF
jgi:uncharacterized membrane protein YeiH